MAVVILGSCAHSLQNAGDLGGSPVDLQEKIETLPAAPAVVPPPEPKAGPTKVTKTPTKKARATKAPTVAKAPPSESTWTPIAWPFGEGETMTFVVRYGLIEGGIAELKVAAPQVIEGESVLHYVGHVHSSKLLQFFYQADDTMESWVRLKDHLPRRQEIQQNESSQFGRRVVVFDVAKQVSKFFSSTTKKNGAHDETRKDEVVSNFGQDIFGGLYFFRFIDKPETVTFPVHDRYKNWNTQLEFMGREMVKVPAGEFNTVKYKMIPRVNGDLTSRGDVMLWFTDDFSKILVQFKAKIKIGAVTGELKAYAPGKAFTFPPPTMKTPTNLTELGERPKP